MKASKSLAGRNLVTIWFRKFRRMKSSQIFIDAICLLIYLFFIDLT